MDCDELDMEAMIFADKIYEEAKKLERYDNANKITDRVLHLHKRYDLLRTILWNKIIENKAQCNASANTVVYLYNYLTEDIGEISTQKTMSNYLTRLKNENAEIVVLIPIAEEHVVYDLTGLEQIESLLN